MEPRRSAHQGCPNLNHIIQPGTKGLPLRGTQSPLLRVVALKKTYATPQGPLTILKGIDFSLNAGSSLALMGESGSGKSTLLHLIAGLDEADDGEIWLNGVLVTALSEGGPSLSGCPFLWLASASSRNFLAGLSSS